ncbi:MAG: GFA family protein [Gammaproteobacteria bacterium]|nr:GFA family protein [Gammaproteobacteria bacterium]
MHKLNGSCGCGAVTYSLECEEIKAVFCYCKQCQIHTGSDKWFGLWVDKDKLSLNQTNVTSFTREGDSGQDLNHLFCSNCGTTVCVDVTVGNFYSVAVSTIKSDQTFTPSMAIYTASAPTWATFPQGVPKFDILPPGLGG